MNGAHSLVRTLLAAGVDTCFANPGTSEMHFVAALDQVPGMRCVLGLQENVVTGMADGYWRLAGKPACTLLHCGPGLANGLGNLHNARRARAGIVNIVGDQATWHRPFDPPLAADTEGLARTVSAWVRTSRSARDVGRDAAAAVQAAATHPGQVATLVLPSDASWDEGGEVAQPLPVPAPVAVDGSAVDNAARVLRSGRKVLLLLAGSALLDEGQQAAWRIAQATGAQLMADYVVGRVARGRGRLPLARVPYATDAAIEALAKFQDVVLVGAKTPVGFFAYPGKPSVQVAAGANVHVLARPEQDEVAALRALAEALQAAPAEMPDPGPRPGVPSGTPTPEKLAQLVAAVLPDHAIVSDESVSYGRGFYPHTHAAAPHDWLHLAGGAIGDGLPVATGAAIGAGAQRRVVSLQADGSAMYSLQALWSSRATGFCSTALAPRATPRCTSATIDTMTTGTSRAVPPGCLSCCSRSQPSMSGSSRSRITTRGRPRASQSSASRAVPTRTTSKPSGSSCSRISSAACSLSSITSAIAPPALSLSASPCAGALSGAASTGSRQGSHTNSCVPWPGVLERATVPPCSRASWLTSTRPRPVPSLSRDSDESLCENMVNRRCASAGAMPMPLSATQICRNSGLSKGGRGRRTSVGPSAAQCRTSCDVTRRASSATSPPSVVNFTALVSRL